MDSMDEAAKLVTYAKLGESRGRYWFSDPNATHSREDALSIIDACQMLDVPVTDVVTTQAWLRLVTRVVALDKKVRELS
jgi:hypothetical protein